MQVENTSPIDIVLLCTNIDAENEFLFNNNLKTPLDYY